MILFRICRQPAFLQTWTDDNITLRVTKNRSIVYRGTPAALTASACGSKAAPCGFSTPDQSIIRTADANLLMALYGHAGDGYKNGSLYTTVFYASRDDGLTWSYLSRVDVTEAMLAGQGPGEGPCEPTMATLSDGRVLAAFRLGGGRPLWLSYSSDHGGTWTDPAPAKGTQAPGAPGVASAVYGVWPQLLVLSNGALVLASGRPGIGFWVSPEADGANWIGWDVEAEHSKNLPSDPWDAAHGDGTTSYTGIAEVEPGMVLLACKESRPPPLTSFTRNPRLYLARVDPGTASIGMYTLAQTTTAHCPPPAIDSGAPGWPTRSLLHCGCAPALPRRRQNQRLGPVRGGPEGL